jgi:cytochrome c oxidase subunit 3
MIVFLGSWVMMFAAVFFVYAVLRLRMPAWPPYGAERLPLGLPGLNTAMIAVSSWTLHRAMRSLRGERVTAYRGWMLITVALGSAFLALQAVVWLDLWESGFRLSSGVYGSVFYVLTAFHALHVVVGLAMLGWLATPAIRRSAPPSPGRTSVMTASMFWHFVGAVWLIMFLTVYVL